MKIILNENVENLGSVGDVVKVKDGYARNFLFPRNIAVLATDGNVKVIEREKAKEIKQERERKAQAEELAKKIQALEISHAMTAGDEGKLFGSVTTNDIQKMLAEKGVDIDKKNIRIPKPIRKLGSNDVEVRCYNNVKAYFKLQVEEKSK